MLSAMASCWAGVRSEAPLAAGGGGTALRLERVRLRNFLTFKDATVELGASTVVIGANDAGKSAVIDAVSWLFRGTDRHGRRPTTQTHLFESKRRWTLKDIADAVQRGEDWPDERWASVEGTFGDLGDRERVT